MSKGHTLRALVNERLTAAAEDIFALFERTIAEYEEELCRSKEENERKQQLLDSVLKPQNTGHGTDVQIQTVTHEEEAFPIVKRESTVSRHFREEQKPCIKSENRQIHELTFIPALDYGEPQQSDASCAPLKQETDESTDTDNDEEWEPLAGSSTQQTEREPDRDGYNHENDLETTSTSRFRSFCADNSSMDCSSILIHHSVCLSRKRKQHDCSFCEKTFRSKRDLQRHMVTHTGEKPYSCPVCKKGFTQQGTVRLHMALHTGEKRHSCPVCAKCFTQKQHLRNHMVTHTGERPFHCTECNANFSVKRTLIRHMKSHIGEKVCFCPICDKGFTRHEHLKSHMQVHTAV